MSDELNFMSITGADADTARQYMSMCNNDVDAAVCCFFAQDAPPAPPPMSAPAPASESLLSRDEHISDERAMQEALAMSMAEAGHQPVSDEELTRRGLLASSVPGNAFEALGSEMQEDEDDSVQQAVDMSMDEDPEMAEAMKKALEMSMQPPEATEPSEEDATLQQFKEMCGIDDTGMAKNYLSAFNGDLNAAVASHMQMNDSEPARLSSGVSASGPVFGASFASLYTAQYGMLHPQFFPDDYDAAVRAARSQGKMLLCYFHDEIEGNHFCRLTLSREPVYEIIDKHFIMFACDNVAGRSLAQKLTREQGSLSDLVNPYLALVNPTLPDKAIEIVQAVYSPEDLVTELKRVWGKHGTELEAQAAQYVSRETDRVARELDRQEQNSEFDMALAADQAREEAEQIRRAEESERQAQFASQEQALAEAKELEMQQHNSAVQARKQAAASLPEEPAAGVKPASKIKCSLPDGTSVMRKFHGDQRVQAVYDWIWGQSCLVDREPGVQLELVCTFPRKVLEPQATVSEAELCPQAMIVVQLQEAASPINSPTK